MVDLEVLARRARRASEWGRLRAASRACLVIVPTVALALVATPSPRVVLGVGAALLATCIGLGCWNAEGARAARLGVPLGAIPMAVGLLTVAIDGWREPARALTMCGAGCLVAGLAAGGATAWYAKRLAPGAALSSWTKIGLVASLTAAMGCIGLGLGSALAVLAAIVVGAALVWVPAGAKS
jgi:hypothetical protein